MTRIQNNAANGGKVKNNQQVQSQLSRERGSDFLRYLEEEVWPKAPPGQLGRRLSREEEDEILGFQIDGEASDEPEGRGDS